ncbi:MAG: ROK family transcriptional regulator [Treponema sp.]|nr:ROK family transcriptional regulator [Treponema sp.]
MPPRGDQWSRTAARIFRTIWRNPSISRIDLAHKLDLDKSTVTKQVAHLIENGLIVEQEEGEASARGGRKPICLSANKEYGHFIGIELQLGFYDAVIVDLSGNILATLRGDTHVTSDNFVQVVLQIIEETRKQRCDSSLLLGVGVGTAGLIDSKKGRIRYSVPLGIDRTMDFAKAMEGKLDVPCFIENDANCCAWGELAFNRVEELKDFLFALVEYRKDETSLLKYGGIGVGFGIVLGGKVHTGAHGYTGEFRSAFCNGPGDLQFSLTRNELMLLRFDRGLLNRAVDELARNMAMLINTMDFQQVFIGGNIEALDVDLPTVLRCRLKENWMYPSPKDVKIRYSSFGDKAVAFGAAGMVFERLLSEHRLPGLASSFSSDNIGGIS